MTDVCELAAILGRVAGEYPYNLAVAQRRDVPRIEFHIRAALDAVAPKRPAEISICDIGGGIGLFSVGCAAAGFRRVVLIDDFRDRVNKEVGVDVLDLHRGYGVEVYGRDVVDEGLDGIDGEFDAITSFDSIEHWHQSPKRLFREVLARLTEGGAFVLGAPNCVNLRKRITVPLGYGKWSSMHAWYEEENFRGHVREPDLADLKYIAADMGLVDIRVFGRNWLGCDHSRRMVRTVARLLDWPLRAVPSLCSDIYVVGRKPARSKQAAVSPTAAATKQLQSTAGPK